MREKILFNSDWKFRKLEYNDKSMELPGRELSGFESISVPHDALIGDAYGFYDDCVLWYARKTGIIPQKNKRYYIYFEGVYMDATVYVNDKRVGDWVNGYTSFYFDITDVLKNEDDLILVRIKYKCPNSRWYGGPGINRNVWLYEMQSEHFCPDSLYVSAGEAKEGMPDKISTGDNRTVRASAEAEITGNKEDISAVFSICDRDGSEIFNSAVLHEDENIAVSIESEAISDNRLLFSVEIKGLHNIKLWDMDEPYLYTLTAHLYKGCEVVDFETVSFGFRDINITNDNGFFLNGRHLKLNGVCLHSDYGALGTAFHRDMALRQVQLMKDMGVNAIRFAHHPTAPQMLDICDEEGVLVMDEAFDCWRGSKTEYDYGRFFDDWSAKDMEAFIKRDRNHPSIIMWSIGNEIYDTHKGPEGIDTLKYLMKLVKKYDPYKNAFVTLCSNYMPWENTQKAADVIKLIGYNYAERLYEEHHKEHPDWFIYGSETASCVQSRGIYHFPLERSLLSDEDMQCSSLGNSTTSWGARSHDFCITTERDTPFSLGQFLWAGIDYLGEPTPYHTKNSYLGIVDTAGFPKDAYYLYKAEWNKREPSLHMLPYWDFNPGQLIDVRICGSGNEAELFKDGVSLGRKRIDHEKGMSLFADYKVPYSEGELRAVMYDINGNAVLEQREHSFKDAKVLRLSQSEFEVKEDEDRLFFVEITALDDEGYEVKNAASRVNISVTGAGYLYGLDNGDSTDYDSFKGSSKRMFRGKLLAIVRSTGKAGRISVKAEIDKNDIPLRKTELIPEGKTLITPDDNDLRIGVKVYPENAAGFELIYEITNEAGVKIQNATVSEEISPDNERTLIVHALADCDMKIRALCREKDGRITDISSLELKAEGFGALFLDPYSFVSASLYTSSFGELGNGNDNGISTPNTGTAWAAFENVDFKGGTDEVIIPVFELASERTEFIFWKGLPHKEGSRIIGRGIYHKPSIWNVYQDETFKLDERLKGIDTFAVELVDHKVHIKGFVFKESNTAFLDNRAKDADEIYGDTFDIRDDAVYGIGNNVSLVFKGLDFTESGTGEVTICGHTKMENNSVHILFEGEGMSEHQIVEFEGSEDFVSRDFKLNGIKGKCDVTFLFLPGCDFDFRSFKFINDTKGVKNE